ncbi:MurR/RpiR family transcriptional regulator [Enterococcus sp. BWR-S5]|uniref:MurR/RpiR family transcriptional regulator n=1 Tax=Enterococcus sp. BWR-S5 TaxID=2787714 RepID=UPI001922818B|nr:MurR/RpiR family transcriptional regulator [Enterococcus sp. BWR-S5]MBL1224425.1 MurR/RpiR family transcriptional regulator [Enterococcus sp. BWR-S5]
MNLRASRVYVRLTEFLFKCVKQDVNYTIAKHLIEHVETFPDIYIEEIAYLSNTTPASVTKFCKRIGYSSFKEMRTDIGVYTEEMFLDGINVTSGIEEAISGFIEQDQLIQKKIFSLLDQEQCLRIANRIAEMEKLAVLGNTYSFSGVNLFRELFSQQGYTIYEVNRRAARDILTSSFNEVEAVFIISLTADWVEKNLEFLQTFHKPLFLLTQSDQSQYSTLFEEIIHFDQFDFLLSSNYYSQKVIHSWIILLSILLKIE